MLKPQLPENFLQSSNRSKGGLVEFEHLELYETYKHGPIQKDEALFLYSLVKMIRPSVILEFGIQEGLSTLNFALAKDDDCLLFSFDIDYYAVCKGISRLSGMPNCHLSQKDCREFVPEDVRGLPVDFCFLDAAHDFEINKQCIRRVVPCMAETGILAIHDTGFWTKEAFEAAPQDYKQNTRAGERLTRHFAAEDTPFPVLRQEQLTANWIVEEFPDLTSIHFHSTNYFRHGISLFQKKRVL